MLFRSLRLPACCNCPTTPRLFTRNYMQASIQIGLLRQVWIMHGKRCSGGWALARWGNRVKVIFPHFMLPFPPFNLYKILHIFCLRTPLCFKTFWSSRCIMAHRVSPAPPASSPPIDNSEDSSTDALPELDVGGSDSGSAYGSTNDSG